MTARVNAIGTATSVHDARAAHRNHIDTFAEPAGSVEVVSRAELARNGRWASAFASKRKDHRYYELVEDTLEQGFDHRYFVIKDAQGRARAIQPFILLDQDLLDGVDTPTRRVFEFIRRFWPRCLVLRTMMVGCAAGEGHLDGPASSHGAIARSLAAAIVKQARKLRAPLVVLKEFPTEYREPLRCFLDQGFSVIPSMPMTKLNIDYVDFDDYMNRALNSSIRRKLRKKFSIAASAPPIEMAVTDDVTPIIEELYPLYLAVYERSKLHFEKLSPDFFCHIGRLMPDKTSFFVWRQNGKAVAFALCMFEDDAFYPEYVGFDYSVALQIHLYHYIVRDMISWAIANGYKWLRSSGLNYDPKLHFRHKLDPIDLYVRHCSTPVNAVLKRILPWIEPTRYDPVLSKFSNYGELWDRTAKGDQLATRHIHRRGTIGAEPAVRQAAQRAADKGRGPE